MVFWDKNHAYDVWTSNGHKFSAGLKWNADDRSDDRSDVLSWEEDSLFFLWLRNAACQRKNIQYRLLLRWFQSQLIPHYGSVSRIRIHSRPHTKTSAVWKYPWFPFGLSSLPYFSFVMHHRIKSRFCRLCHSRRVAALASPKADTGSTGARAGPVFAPGAPGAILLDLVWVFPHAVTFVAPLEKMTQIKRFWLDLVETSNTGASFFMLSSHISQMMMLTSLYRNILCSSFIYYFRHNVGNVRASTYHVAPKTNLPFQKRTPSHPEEVPSWFYRSTGCRGDCTTAVCTGQMCETETEEQKIRCWSRTAGVWNWNWR